MNPLRLYATNLGTYEELDLELPVGCVAILGENGAGKSTILAAIELALFGPPGRQWADYLTADTDGLLEVELTFEHADDVYRVRRAYSARGRGQSKVDLERASEGGWEPLTREKAQETQALLERMLGLTRDTFRASAFLAQRDGSAFTAAGPAARKQILQSILGLDLWDDLARLAAIERKELDPEIAALAHQVDLAAAELARRPQLIAERDQAAAAETDAAARATETQARVDRIVDRVGAAQAAAAEAKAAVEAFRALDERWLDLDTRFDRLCDEDMELQEQLSGCAVLAARAGQVELLEEALEATQMLARADRDLAAAAAAVERHDRELLDATTVVHDLMHSARPVCQTCGQPTIAAAYERALAEAREKVAAIEKAAAAASDDLAFVQAAREKARATLGDLEGTDVAHDLAQARLAREELAAMGQREKRRQVIAEETQRMVGEIHELAEERAAARERANALYGILADVDAHARDLEDARATLSARREEQAQAARAVTRVDAELERLATVEAQASDARWRLDRARADHETVVELERAFGRNGIPALILENAAIPQIETEANRILRDLHAPYTVELRTQRAAKTTDRVQETLEIIVTDGPVERSYETFSGGERTRLDLALRIALARLLASRRGAEVRLLAIDEPEFLDAAGTEALVSVLRGLHDFDRVLLVSHHEGLRDAFDQALVVTKTDGRSSIAGAREQVPA